MSVLAKLMLRIFQKTASKTLEMLNLLSIKEISSIVKELKEVEVEVEEIAEVEAEGEVTEMETEVTEEVEEEVMDNNEKK